MDYEASIKTALLTHPKPKPHWQEHAYAHLLDYRQWVHPLGSHPALQAVANSVFKGDISLSSAYCRSLEALSGYHGLKKECFLLAPSGADLYRTILMAYLGMGRNVILSEGSCFLAHHLFTGEHLLTTDLTETLEQDLACMVDFITNQTRLIIIGNPNYWTGDFHSTQTLSAFIQQTPKHVVTIVDESFIEYQTLAPTLAPLIQAGLPVLGLRTFNTLYGFSKCPLAYAYGDPGLIGLLHRAHILGGVSALALAASAEALKEASFLKETNFALKTTCKQMAETLGPIGQETLQKEGPFMLLRSQRATAQASALGEQGLLVNTLAPVGLAGYIALMPPSRDDLGCWTSAVMAALAAIPEPLPSV